MPWRVAVYYWETGDKRVLPLMQALAKFFTGEKEARTLDSLNFSRAPWIAPASVYLTSAVEFPGSCVARGLQGDGDLPELTMQCCIRGGKQRALCCADPGGLRTGRDASGGLRDPELHRARLVPAAGAAPLLALVTTLP